jgi:C4-dicarboxylate-specific signal transduction histidine kinase
MTCADHTTAWRRLKRAVMCTACGLCRGDCACRPLALRDRFSALWRRLRRSGRKAEAMRRKVDRLRAEMTALEARMQSEIEKRRQAESDLAAERYAKRMFLDTMTAPVGSRWKA